MMKWPGYEPPFDDPYPPFEVDAVTDFKYDQDLYIARKSDGLRNSVNREGAYVVYTDYVTSMKIRNKATGEISDWTITVPPGFVYDLTSVPAVFRVFVGRVGAHLEAATVHDFLYVAWQRDEEAEAREQDFVFSNLVMDAAMKAAKVKGWRRRAIIFAVETFISRRRFFKRDETPHYVIVPDPAKPLPLAEGDLSA